MVLGKLLVPGRPTNLDYSRARAFCACRRCGLGGCLDIFIPRPKGSEDIAMTLASVRS